MDDELIKRYLSGNASLKERMLIVEWAKADKKNMKELLTLRKLHDIAIWQQEGTKQKKNNLMNTRRTIYIITSIAAVFLLLLLGIGIHISTIKKQIPEMVMQTIHVPAGQRAELILADSTRVWLNAGSALRFPNHFSANAREVYLDGEGYFDVKKDTERDFIVHTSSYDIKVLGTEFNVLAYSESGLFEVSLIKGSINIYSEKKNETIRPEPGCKVFLSDNKLHKIKIKNYNTFLWKDGIICFDDEPIHKMIAKLELYFDIRIIVENNRLESTKYTGKFRTKDGIEHILRVLRLKEKFIYEKDDDKNIIIIR